MTDSEEIRRYIQKELLEKFIDDLERVSQNPEDRNLKMMELMESIQVQNSVKLLRINLLLY